MKDKITKNIYAPNTGGSGGRDRWYAEIRRNGWLMKDGYFSTKAKAMYWLKNQKIIKMDKDVARRYIQMAKKYQNK